MDFELSARSEHWRRKLQTFFDREVLPRNRAYLAHVAKGEAAPFMAELQVKAREQGLWNLGLPELAPDEPGTRLSNLEYAPLAEIMGRLFWAPEAFNCQAPDVPNMIALQNCATAEQKKRWLDPLLNAKTRSAFGMTEPDVASSDATNVATKIVRDGNDYVITGRKWFITGAAHPNCSFLIVMGVTNADAERTAKHSCIIVPMDTPGVRLVRRLRWMGCEDHVAPIGELAFDKVRVPRENLLGAEGEGFQGRADPARACAHPSLHALDRAVRTADRIDDGARLRTLGVRPHRHPIRHRAALDRGVPRRARAGAAALLSLRLAARPDRPSWRLGGTSPSSRSRCPRCCSGSPTARCRCSAPWAARRIRRSIRRSPGDACCGSATGRTKCICARFSAWRRCRPGRSPIPHISPRIPHNQFVFVRRRS